MRIIGPEELVFGVDDLEGARAFLKDYGLTETVWRNDGGTFQALDNSGITIRSRDNLTLPPPLPSNNMLRKTIYGVADQASVDEIAGELSRDRQVDRLDDGSIAAYDDLGFYLGFRVTKRRVLDMEPERLNTAGAKPERAFNVTGASPDMDATPRVMSHIVYFVPDVDKAEGFYRNRLRFELSDRFTNLGPFLRPRENHDHHTLFFIKTPPHMVGLEHVAFHMRGPTEVMLAGTRMIEKGYQSFWGPGRHWFASNWFWYFNSPLGAHLEYDADMDVVDENWEPRSMQAGAHQAQLFLFQYRERWTPTGEPEAEESSHS